MGEIVLITFICAALYERFREEVIFRKCEFAFSWIFLGYFVFELLPETAEYGFSNNFTLFGAN